MVLKETDWNPSEIGNENTKEHTKDSRQEIARNRAGAAEKRRVLVPGQVARSGERGSGECGSETTIFVPRQGSDPSRTSARRSSVFTRFGAVAGNRFRVEVELRRAAGKNGKCCAVAATWISTRIGKQLGTKTLFGILIYGLETEVQQGLVNNLNPKPKNSTTRNGKTGTQNTNSNSN